MFMNELAIGVWILYTILVTCVFITQRILIQDYEEVLYEANSELAKAMKRIRELHEAYDNDIRKQKEKN